MKHFDRAIWKLSGIYTAILFLICVGFSVAIFTTADSEFRRPRPEIFIEQYDYGVQKIDVHTLMNRRDEAIRGQLLAKLFIINICVLVGGAVVSYFLARWTLRPVREATEKESRFVSDASHELRTPLTAIQMENEVLLRDAKATKDDYKKQVKSNLEEVVQLSELSVRLLNLSKNEKLPLSEVDIAEVINHGVKKVYKLSIRKNIVMETEIKPMKITANAEALGEILVILLDNAIKYSPKNSVVTVGNNEKGIYVRDQGSGVAPVDLPRIFDRFYRAEKSRTTVGYGLGLSLAQHLASQQNLRIVAENLKKTGAQFTILI